MIKPTLARAVATLTRLALLTACQPKNGEWSPLVDDNLSQWDIYLSYKIPADYDGSVPLDPDSNPIEPLGFRALGNQAVVSTYAGADSTEIRISGEYYGAIITRSEYQNYHLRLQGKWGGEKWPPREDKLKDSGILYHSRGEPGIEYFRSWMLSQEFQIMEGHMGDYWNQATSLIDIKAYPREYIKNPAADPRADWITIGEGSNQGTYAMRSANYESPEGEWTQLDLISFEGQSLHIVNGEVVMALRNSRYVDETGREQPLDSGKIQIQSEATEVFFRDIAIRPLNQLPTEYAPYFEQDDCRCGRQNYSFNEERRLNRE